MRPDAEALEPVGVPAFQTDGLPNAGERSVPALFPEWKFGERRVGEHVRIIARAIDAHLDLVHAGDKLLCDVEAEGKKSANVVSHQCAIDPDMGDMKHRTKEKKNSPFTPVR